MPGGGSKPGERRSGRQRGTPNKTLTEQAQALAAKVAKAEARANAKLVALAHAIQATVAESRGLPGASARERFKELVLNALVAEKLALKEIAHEPVALWEDHIRALVAGDERKILNFQPQA